MLLLLLSIFAFQFHHLAGALTSPSPKSCYNITLSFTLTSTNGIWGLSDFTDNYDVTAYTSNYTRRDALTTFNPLSGTENTTATYTIVGTLCEPTSGSASTLLLATHGLTYDRYYWDSPYQPSNYSFVDFVTAKGYSVFFYDRVGAGESSKPSGYVNQASIQVSVLEQLVSRIRNAGILAASSSIPKKIVLVGHSFGSVLSNALVASNPDIVDAIVLTGWGFDPRFFGLTLAAVQPRLANTLNHPQWIGYDSGYIGPVDIYAATEAFYKVGLFDTNLIQYFWDHHTSPAAIMEFCTIATLTYASPKVTAPVLLLDGEYDSVMCGGYCPGDIEPAASEVFSASVGYESYIQPNSGHCINQHYNATGAYGVITDFLAKNGL